jgi:hypothetical protein
MPLYQKKKRKKKEDVFKEMKESLIGRNGNEFITSLLLCPF